MQLFNIVNERVNKGRDLVYSADELEKMADKILEEDLKSMKSNKARLREYNFLSESQMIRRRRREIPFSSLAVQDKIKLGIPTID